MDYKTIDYKKLTTNLSPDLKNSFSYRRSKNVYDKKMIYESSLENVSLKGIGSIELSNKHTLSHKDTLVLHTNTRIENISPRPSSTISFKLDHLDLSNYNYFGAWVYVEATGYNGFYFHFMTGNEKHYTNQAPIIIPNKWQYVVWDATHIVRDDINIFSITPFLMGCPPEAEENIDVYVDSIFAFNSDKLYDLGWNLENRIAYSHTGYLLNEKKTAIIENNSIENNLLESFTIRNIQSNKTYTFKTEVIPSSFGSFLLLDFSSITEEGEYILEAGKIKSEKFVISKDAYLPLVLKSLNFLHSLRCGEHIEGVHTKCHLNCKTVHPLTGQTVPNFGGWHDAGDVSQFEIPTAEITASLLDLAANFEDTLLDRILDEAKVGLDWLYQTRFKDGYRAMAVLYSIWRDNVCDEDNKTVLANKAERGAFENALSSIAFGKGALAFKKRNNTYYDFLLRLAISDFDFASYEYNNNIFTVRWGSPICSQTLGALLVCAGILYELTNDKKYLEYLENHVEDVISTQESDPTFPLPGFFYEDTMHKYILAYEHRGHEEYPVLGLINAYKHITNKALKEKIYSSLVLYGKYCKDSIKYSSPYGLLPGHIYNINKVNLEHYTVPKTYTTEEALAFLEKQIKTGTDLGNGYYLRIMPISFTRRGFEATLLSKTKAVSALSKVLNDKDLRDIAIRQIEWTVGYNPFSTSLMYGEGYNYHDLYVAFSNQIVGSLPVGMMTKENLDAPYWPDCTNSVFKEIWGHTTGKLLTVLSDIWEKN